MCGLGACSLALDFAGIDDGARDGSAGVEDAAVSPDARADGPGFDATSDAVSPPDDAPPPNADATDAPATFPTDGACPTLPGPVLVPAGGFCIDSTEVTVAQFTTYLAAKGGSLAGQPALCAWNTSLVPGGWPPAGSTAQPVPNANWCQAYMFCQWAGKRLCGAPDGGPADPNGWYDATKSEWFAACSRNDDGLHDYPYGNAYETAACNGVDYDAGKALPSLASCVGGYPGLHDMSGNVYEWEDSCGQADGGTALTGPNDYCHTRGGAYDQVATTLQCDDGTAYTRESQSPNLGFRCCSP
jgi:formylglycine-generating enzyme required for sulfatase activity